MSDCTRLELEVIEYKRRYITIDLPHDAAETVCRNLLEYNPTHQMTEEAIKIIRSVEPVKTEIFSDEFEIGTVEVIKTGGESEA